MIFHHFIAVQLGILVLGVGAKVCTISLSLSLHIAMYSSCSTSSVFSVALPCSTSLEHTRQAQ